jgi:hypothetical protein
MADVWDHIWSFRNLLALAVLCVGIIPQVVLWAEGLKEIQRATEALIDSEITASANKTGGSSALPPRRTACSLLAAWAELSWRLCSGLHTERHQRDRLYPVVDGAGAVLHLGERLCCEALLSSSPAARRAQST